MRLGSSSIYFFQMTRYFFEIISWIIYFIPTDIKCHFYYVLNVHIYFLGSTMVIWLLCIFVPGPHILISHYCSFLEFPWLFLNVYSSRWTLESFFKFSKKILLEFSLESHLIYRLILGGELDSSQFWVLHENDTWFPNCSGLCLNVPLCVCVCVCITNRYCLFPVKFVSGCFTGFCWFYD